MKIHRTNRSPEVDQDHGFTLIEILIAIVLIGILSAVAVVGISSLVSKGSTSACSATLDASKAASAVYFASNTNTYPLDFFQLTNTVGGANTAVSSTPAALSAPSGVTVAATTLKSGTSWTLTGTFGTALAPASPTFACT
ncbi:MAG: type II secretion system protein [Ilumatobacteraceae bacterium]